MTFKLIVMGFESYIDIETLDDLAGLAGEYTLCDKFMIDFKNMTITIE